MLDRQLLLADLGALEVSIERSFIGEFCLLKPKLIQLIAGDCLPSLLPAFSIHHCRVLRTYFEIRGRGFE
jgi:hypothetical protein